MVTGIKQPGKGRGRGVPFGKGDPRINRSGRPATAAERARQLAADHPLWEDWLAQLRLHVRAGESWALQLYARYALPEPAVAIKLAGQLEQTRAMSSVDEPTLLRLLDWARAQLDAQTPTGEPH